MADDADADADERWMKEAIGLVGNNNLCTNLLEISVSQTLTRLDVPFKLSPDRLVRTWMGFGNS